MLRLASTARLARRAFATEAAPKIDWAELTSFVQSDEAKREIALLKKTMEDMKEQVAAEAKARRPAERACCAQLPRGPDGPFSRSRAAAGATAGAGGSSTRPAAAARAAARRCARSGLVSRLLLKPRVGAKLGSLARPPQEPEPIDWAFYRKHITAPGVVDTFEKALKGKRPLPAPFSYSLLRPTALPRRLLRATAAAARRATHARGSRRAAANAPATARADLKLPKYEGKEVEELAAAFAELEKKAEASAAQSAKRMEEIKREIAAIAVEKEKLKSLTIDEILAADPALKQKLDQEIREDKWY